LSEAIYWQMLEAGFRLTPTAGSHFDFKDTHLGYNRVYIHSQEKPTVASWWQSIRKGQTMVTNGPLLRTNVNQLPPGSVQASYRGQSIALDIQASLTVRDPVDYLDVIFNGETLYSAKLEDHYNKGEFPPLEIGQSGWLVVRVVTAHDQGYRLATTAPYYFEFDGKPRVSRRAVQFFRRWLELAKAAIEMDSKQSKAMQPWLQRAEEFWEMKLKQCNAD
jgi:predicted RNA binding protein YcfA (HicA-like mRNA interferase family)